MCGIVPSSGQPEYLFTGVGKNAPRTNPNTAAIGTHSKRLSNGPIQHALSGGHTQNAIKHGPRSCRTPSAAHSATVKLMSKLSFSPHHGHGKVPQRTLLICLPQTGHLGIFSLRKFQFTPLFHEVLSQPADKSDAVTIPEKYIASTAMRITA